MSLLCSMMTACYSSGMETLPSTAAARVGAGGCIDGLITVPTADGPALTACHCTDCKRVHAAARTERAVRAAVTTAFDRLPVATDEEF